MSIVAFGMPEHIFSSIRVLPIAHTPDTSSKLHAPSMLHFIDHLTLALHF
jgi:hypothetical protein